MDGAAALLQSMRGMHTALECIYCTHGDVVGATWEGVSPFVLHAAGVC